jgi:large subunit ribosomal protein L18
LIQKQDANKARLIRHYRVRKNISGTVERPRLCVYRSNKHIVAQVIDDNSGHTLVAASSLEKAIREELKYGGNIAAAKAIGTLVAKRALEQGINMVVFDRGGYLYHGRVAALADAAREGGLKF